MPGSILEAVMGPDSEILPIATRAAGVYVYDAEGRRYIDASSGAFVSTVGHCVPEITAAVKNQLDTLTYIHWSQMSNLPAQELASLILELTPGHTKVHLVGSGSEAVEAAIYAAQLYHRNRGDHQRHKIITRDGSYHGATLGAMSATGVPGLRWTVYEHGSFRKIQRNECGRCPFALEYPSCMLMCATDLERAILAEGPKTVSAFLVDPSASWGWPPPDYWPTVKAICDKHGVLLIADEVKSGFGKTGKPFALQNWDVTPDINVFGKSLGGGYAPIAGLSVDSRLAQTFEEVSRGFQTGHTFMANPLTCAAALATQRYMRDHRLMDRAPIIEDMMRKRFEPIVATYERARAFYAMGTLCSLMLDAPGASASESPLARNRSLRTSLMRNGVISWVASGPGFSRVQFVPPFIFQQEHVDELGSAIESTLRELA
jgi:adenosylmethionine-8-amino-7-oxononanoate aminotransferase